MERIGGMTKTGTGERLTPARRQGMLPRFTATTAAFLLLTLAAPSFADEEASAAPYITATPHGRFYFKMLPEGDCEAGGRGGLYHVESGADSLVYETSGWYSFKVFVSDEGQYLCRVGNSGRIGDWYFKDKGGDLKSPHNWIAHSPKEQVALAFYDRGQPIKTYFVADLVEEKNLQFSFSHYSFFKDVQFHTEALSDFQKEAAGMGDSHGCWIIAKTVDEATHVFDMRTGRRVGGAELVAAFAMTDRDALKSAAAYLNDHGLQWQEPRKCAFVGDFQYSVLYETPTESHELLVDRRTGSITVKK